jgi:hypothetical protein
MQSDLNEADRVLLKAVEQFVEQSKSEGVERHQALGEIDLLMNVATFLEMPSEASENRMRELVLAQFEESWPE